MKITTNSLLNMQAFYDFVKLDVQQQCEVLSSYGIILDQDVEKDFSTKLYFLHGFFVEKTVCLQTNKVMDVIPYKSGYKIGSFIVENLGRKVSNDTIRWCVN